MVTTPEEQALARKYKRITGVEPTGLIDTLRIIFSEDMRDELQSYIRSMESDKS